MARVSLLSEEQQGQLAAVYHYLATVATPLQRNIVVLRYLSDLSMDDICEHINLPLWEVEAHHDYIIRLMRKEIGEIHDSLNRSACE